MHTQEATTNIVASLTTHVFLLGYRLMVDQLYCEPFPSMLVRFLLNKQVSIKLRSRAHVA